MAATETLPLDHITTEGTISTYSPPCDMRWRIVALLQEHPEGLSLAQTRRLLDVDKDLSSTMKAMARDGLLRRVQTGWYVAVIA